MKCHRFTQQFSNPVAAVIAVCFGDSRALETRVQTHDGGLIERHDRRFVRIEERVTAIESLQSAHEQRLRTCEDGVSNFRRFQRTTLNHQWYMKGIGAALLAIGSGLWWTVDHAIDRLMPAAKVLIEYYDETHPSAHLPKISQQSDIQLSAKPDTLADGK